MYRSTIFLASPRRCYEEDAVINQRESWKYRQTVAWGASSGRGVSSN